MDAVHGSQETLLFELVVEGRLGNVGAGSRSGLTAFIVICSSGRYLPKERTKPVTALWGEKSG